MSILSMIDIFLIAGTVAFVLGGVLTAYAFPVSQARSLLFKHAAMKKRRRTAGILMMAAGVNVATKS